MEALRLYTRGSAYYTFDDEDLGSIEVGKLGDLVVLSDDYLSVPEDEIRTLGSVLTLIGGEVVHAAGALAATTCSALPQPANSWWGISDPPVPLSQRPIFR